MIGNCIKCNRVKKLPESGKTKNICNVCYKKLIWVPKLIKCRRCKRDRPMHAKKLCRGCYQSVFHIDKVKIYNTKKYHNLDYGTYRNATKICVICGFMPLI